jgi:hypothetical protein
MLKFILGIVAAIPVYIFLFSCSWNMLQVATANPAEMDAKAGQAISNVTNDFAKLVIDEVDPVNILGNKVLDELDIQK